MQVVIGRTRRLRDPASSLTFAELVKVSASIPGTTAYFGKFGLPWEEFSLERSVEQWVLFAIKLSLLIGIHRTRAVNYSRNQHRDHFSSRSLFSRLLKEMSDHSEFNQPGGFDSLVIVDFSNQPTDYHALPVVEQNG